MTACRWTTKPALAALAERAALVVEGGVVPWTATT